MIYASIEDIWRRKGTDISDTDYVTALLEDAAIIIDAYNRNATVADLDKCKWKRRIVSD